MSELKILEDNLNFLPKDTIKDTPSAKMDSISSKSFEVSDKFKENLFPCSNKAALFELMERQFLSNEDSKELTDILTSQINKIRSPLENKFVTRNEVSVENTELTKAEELEENIKSEPVLQRIVKGYDMKLSEEDSQRHFSDKGSTQHNDSKTKSLSEDAGNNSDGEDNILLNREETKSVPNREDFEKFLDEKMKEQNKDEETESEEECINFEFEDEEKVECKDLKEEEGENIDDKKAKELGRDKEELDNRNKIDQNEYNDVLETGKDETEENEISQIESEKDIDEDYEEENTLKFDSDEEDEPLSLHERRKLRQWQMGGLVSNLLGKRKSERKRPRISYKEDVEDDNEIKKKKRKIVESEDECEEMDCEDTENQGVEEHKNNEDEQEENIDATEHSNEGPTKPLSMMEQRRLSRMQMMGTSNLQTVRDKFQKLSTKLESPKKEPTTKRESTTKRKRYSLMDSSTRALIKEITPVRRSSRQIERKFYSEGVDDPEMMAYLQKIEAYRRRLGTFTLPLDESVYHSDFAGFAEDESRSDLYEKKRRIRRSVPRSGRGVPVPSLDPCDITDDILSRVVTHVSAKVIFIYLFIS